MILAADVGGTKCNLALVEKSDGQLSVRQERRFPSRDYPQFSDVVAAFLAEVRETVEASPARQIEAAGFGVAGPIIGNRVHVTNVGWEIDSQVLARQIGTQSVVLLNDLAATAYGLHWLGTDQLSTLNVGKRRARAAQALIAAGTGLGEAILNWSGRRYIVAPSEGGHCDFAPRTDQEIELLRYMKKKRRAGQFRDGPFRTRFSHAARIPESECAS